MANTALACLVSVGCLMNPASGFSPYLDSLERPSKQAPPPLLLEHGTLEEALRPEEHYGVTNPMANNWPGSKHQKYGGYLTRLSPAEETIVKNYNVDCKAPDEWYAQAHTSAQQRGGYLQSLQQQQPQQQPGSFTDDQN